MFCSVQRTQQSASKSHKILGVLTCKSIIFQFYVRLMSSFTISFNLWWKFGKYFAQELKKKFQSLYERRSFFDPEVDKMSICSPKHTSLRSWVLGVKGQENVNRQLHLKNFLASRSTSKPNLFGLVFLQSDHRTFRIDRWTIAKMPGCSFYSCHTFCSAHLLAASQIIASRWIVAQVRTLKYACIVVAFSQEKLIYIPQLLAKELLQLSWLYWRFCFKLFRSVEEACRSVELSRLVSSLQASSSH